MYVIKLNIGNDLLIIQKFRWLFYMDLIQLIEKIFKTFLPHLLYIPYFLHHF